MSFSHQGNYSIVIALNKGVEKVIGVLENI